MAESVIVKNEIVEYGYNNSLGQYWKFSSGLLICTKIVSVSDVAWNAWGSLYESDKVLGGTEWAYPFNMTPYVSVQITMGHACWVASVITDTSSTKMGTFRVARPTNPGTTNIVSAAIIAVGNWK